MTTSARAGATRPTSRPPLPRQGPFTRWPRSSDAVLAILVFGLEVTGILSRAAQDAGEFDISLVSDVPAATYLLLAASSIALLWRRSRPLVVLAVTLGASLAWDIIELEDGPSLAIFVSLYGVGRLVEQRKSFQALVAACVIVVADDLVIEREPASVIGLSMALVFLAWYVGRRVRARRSYLALVEERAEYLEREKAAEAQRAVDTERTRIARELHDLVAHRVSMITVQAGAAQTVVASDPNKAIRAMESVEEAGREALDELRQILGVLRADGKQNGLTPLHGLEDISSLISNMKRSGVDVALHDDRVDKSLPARVDLAAYRIVQEALTNVLKHAGPDPDAEIRLSNDDETLTIEVTDRGHGDSTKPGSGHGLVGMRERVTLLGGSFDAGPRLGGGFRITAKLPLLGGQA